MKITLHTDDLEITKEIKDEQELNAVMDLFKSKEERPEIKLVPFLNWN